MTKIVKIVFIDTVTGEIYAGEEKNSMKCKFTKDLAGAKLYAKSSQLKEIFDYVKYNSGRDLQPIEIEVSYEVLGKTMYLEQLENDSYKLFQTLDEKATNDIDSMTDKEYRKWKDLKKKFSKFKKGV